MKQFVKYVSLAAGIAAFMMVAALPAQAAWTAFTGTGARTTTLNGKSGHFEIIDNFIHALGGNGSIYKWNKDIYNTSSEGGSWESVTGDAGTDVFQKFNGKFYIMGDNGAVYRWDPSGSTPLPGVWTQITKDGARSSANLGKSGHFEIATNGFLYVLGGNGAVYQWSIGLSDPDIANKTDQGTWNMATPSGATDVFTRTSDGYYYALGQNGAIFRTLGSSWTQVTKDGARSSANSGKSGHFEIIDNFIHALGGDGAIYKWSKSITETPDPDGGSWGSALTSAGGTDVFKKGPLVDKPWYILGQNGAVYQEGEVVSSGGDTIQPIISAVAASNITSTGATITWTTNESATSVVEYGPTITYEMGIGTDVILTTNHSIVIVGLTANTLYHYRVKSTDAAGNVATSGDYTFTTLSATGISAPTITSLSLTSGTVGSFVTITGTGFATASAAVKNTVNFGATAITNLTSSSGTTLIFQVPGVATGTYNVTVSNANGTSNAATFTVTAPSVTSGLIVTLTPTPTSVAPNQTITVIWTVNQGTPQVNDWIGLFQSGAGNTSYVTFQYATGASTGTLIFTAPSTPGSYQFRYLPRNSYVDVGRSTAVVVQGDITTAPSLTFTASPTTVTAGQPSTLSWSFSDAAGSCTFSRGGEVTQNGVQKAWSSLSGISGTVTAAPTVTTGYDLSCTDANGTAAKSVDIVVTPSASIQQCDTSAAAAKIAEATSKLSSCIAGIFDDCALASSLLLEATNLLASCVTVTPAGTPPPGSVLYDGLDVKANAAIYVRSSPEISSANKLNNNLPLPIGAIGTINCSAMPASGVTAPIAGVNCPTIANGYIWWYVNWDLYEDGWSAEQAPTFTGLIIPATTASPPPPPPPPITDIPSVIITEATHLELPKSGSGLGSDSNNPCHWVGGTINCFISQGLAWRSSGASFDTLPTPAEDTNYLSSKTSAGGKWMEATYKDESTQTLYGMYHHEPASPCPDGKRTAPKIGMMTSMDDGKNWTDLGIILNSFPASNDCESANVYFVGGYGDFSAIYDSATQYFYIFFSSYIDDPNQQGIGIARLSFLNKDSPVGKVETWCNGVWHNVSLSDCVTPIFPAGSDLHKDGALFPWGASVHYNTYLQKYVVLYNYAKDTAWGQDGVYISFNSAVSNPNGWSLPVKIIEGGDWYPQVIGISSGETDKLAGQMARLFIHAISDYTVSFSTSGGSVAATSIPFVFRNNDSIKTIVGLHINSAAGTDAARIGFAPSGSTFEVSCAFGTKCVTSKDGYYWVRVKGGRSVSGASLPDGWIATRSSSETYIVKIFGTTQTTSTIQSQPVQSEQLTSETIPPKLQIKRVGEDLYVSSAPQGTSAKVL